MASTTVEVGTRTAVVALDDMPDFVIDGGVCWCDCARWRLHAGGLLATSHAGRLPSASQVDS